MPQTHSPLVKSAVVTKVVELGLTRYADAMQFMQRAHAEVVERTALGHPEVRLLVTEHHPVVTMGNRMLLQDLKLESTALLELGIDFEKTDRGGSVTVHEPGQLVVYPLVPLRSLSIGVRAYVHILEETMIQTCARFGVVAARDPVHPGVWVRENKVGAIGIRVEQGVTRHGLAFNICNTLSTFAHVVPCGIHGRGVTTLAVEANGKNKQLVQTSTPGVHLDSVRPVLMLFLKNLLEAQ